MKLLTALVLAVLPQGFAQPLPRYRIERAYPERFLILTALPWLHVFTQSSMIISMPTGAPPPTIVRFSNHANLQLELPISYCQPLGNNRYEIKTPIVIVPNLTTGPVGIQVVNPHLGVQSPRKFGFIQ
ncbi:MAG TPA: hypothetical protein VK843_12810 [Planctomycetota bacterium]|nr:hypothetical protein [Planctomycetota bacterium]